MSAPTTARGAAVRIPFPPAVFAIALLGTLALHAWVLTLDLPDSTAITVAGIVLVIAGVALAFSGVATVLRHHTTIVPDRAVARLVTDGPYRISRNPMYTGLAITYTGVALWIGTWWPLIALPLCVLATLTMVIRPEEVYLSERFGADYEAYRARVRRWL